MSHVQIIIQCRTSSARLPGKAFLPVQGISSVVLCAKRAMTSGLPVTIATSNASSDNSLAQHLAEHHISYIRGPLEDVLRRYVLASATLDEQDFVVRLTADNVFPDGSFINELVDHALTNNIEYCTTDFKKNGLPYGLAAEIFKVLFLRKADLFAQTLYEREHVTPWLQKNCTVSTYLYRTNFNLSHRRCTLDNLSDYLRLQKIFEKIPDPVKSSWQQLCTRLHSLNISSSAPDMRNMKIPISYITLGTAQLGIPYGITNKNELMVEENAYELVRHAIKRGITSFDSARGYGLAEKRLGFALARKDGITIVTKLDPFLDEHLNTKAYQHFTLASIYRSCYELQRESLDILMLHRFAHYQNPTIWAQLQTLKMEGTIKHLGVSINSPEEALYALRDDNIECIQLPFNIVDWRWHDETLQALIKARTDVTFFCRSVFLQGLLISPITQWPDQFRSIGQSLLHTLNELSVLLSRESIHDLCIAYVNAQPWIDSTVIGCISVQQFDENIELFNKPKLTHEECAVVTKMLPKLSGSFLNPSLW